MKKIGLFFGSDTGNTEEVANKIQATIGEDKVEIHDMYEVEVSTFDQYDQIILGLSTWHDGQLQSDWDSFFEDFKTVDFSGKTIALFGLGDQYVYSEYFVDGIGIVAKEVLANGGKIVGKWSTEGYEHTESKGEMEKGFFVGLAIDEDNQFDESDERIEKWVAQITEEFPIEG
ncbi:MAG: flavodoxin [Flavobacteriales bacterium]